jgi:hypothetical protein
MLPMSIIYWSRQALANRLSAVSPRPEEIDIA